MIVSVSDVVVAIANDTAYDMIKVIDNSNGTETIINACIIISNISIFYSFVSLILCTRFFAM